MSGIQLPLTLSMVGHAVCLTLLVLLLGKPPSLPEPVAKGGIEVFFQPALPNVEPAPVPPPPSTVTPPPEPQAELVPPAPEAPAVVTEPTPPTPEPQVTTAEPTPPPARKPAVRKPRPVQRHDELPQPSQAYTQTPQTAPAPLAPPQTASVAIPIPAPMPSPEAAAGYRALLSAWLESHKRYPDAARQRGEEGRAVLRFAVDRSGRVIDYAVTKSSGYPDLDESVEEMMRGATLPPFPAGMPEPRMQVSVTIRFSLRR